MSTTDKAQPNIIEPPYFSNWADLFLPKIANAILPLALKVSWLTPNFITLFSFSLYVLGCVMIFIDVPGHAYYTAILLPLAYVGDCLDGQVARARSLSSPVGNYFDKVVDVLKIYVLTMSLAYGVYLNTQNVLYVFLGFSACFFFNFRYYIKLETVFSQSSEDPGYLDACRARKQELYREKDGTYKRLATSFTGRVKLFWLKHRSIFWVDEAEFVIFTSVAALLNAFEVALWIFAISQTIIAFWRLFERAYLTHTLSKKLLDPLRK